MSQETFSVGNGKPENHPPYEEGEFIPFPASKTETADSPDNIRITSGMGVEFLDPKTGEVREGRVGAIGALRDSGEVMVHIDSGGIIYEVSLKQLQKHMFKVLKSDPASPQESKERAN